MEKPKLIQSEPYYDWNKIEEYMLEKYGIEIDWDWVVNEYDIRNESTRKIKLSITCGCGGYLCFDCPPKNIVNFLSLLKKEFETETMNIHFWW